jgi:anaerobic selenocysteine-containing dehydrogenase
LPDYSNSGSGENENAFPLVFITPNTGSRIHSQFGNLDIIRKTVENPAAVAISPGDASARNIKTGDKIKSIIPEVRCTAWQGSRTGYPRGVWYCRTGFGLMKAAVEIVL